jgi:hypothetical protein
MVLRFLGWRKLLMQAKFGVGELRVLIDDTFTALFDW